MSEAENTDVMGQLKDLLANMTPKKQEPQVELADLIKMIGGGGFSPETKPVGMLLPCNTGNGRGYVQFGPEATTPEGFQAALQWIRTNGLEPEYKSNNWGNNRYRSRSNNNWGNNSWRSGWGR